MTNRQSSSSSPSLFPDHDERRPPRHASSAPKTRACSNCARLKMKCAWPRDDSGRSSITCARCSRMKMACDVPAPSQRRKRGKSSRVALLEQKIDGIMSLLAENQHSRQSDPSPMTPESQLTLKNSPPIPQIPPILEKSTLKTQTEPPRSTRSSNQTLFHLIPDFQLTAREASRFLSIYTSEYAPNFPFVMVPSVTTAHSLHDQSPGLFWAIMTAVAPQSFAVQQHVKTWFRQYMAEHIIARQEKTLQLLQAILVHLAWSDFHFYINAEATNFVHLALALAMDLHLDKSPESGTTTIRSQLGEAWTVLHPDVPCRLGVPHTLDDKRAVLGLYHLSSLISALFKRGPRFPWTPYLSQCCSSLTNAHEHESDMHLVALVHIQHIADKAYSILPTPGAATRDTRTYRVSLDMAITHVRRELDSFVGTQPDTVKQNKLFTTCHHVLTMRLYEPAVMTTAAPLTDPDSLPSEPFLRAEALEKCLDSARESFAALLSIPPAQLCRLPLTGTAALAFTIVTTCRLLFIDTAAPDWLPDAARKKLDFPAALKAIADNFGHSDKWAVENTRKRRLRDGVENRLDHYISTLRWIRQWYLSKTGQGAPQLSESQTQEDALMPADDEPWPDVRLDFDFWPDLISMADVAMQTFPGNTWSDI